MIAKPYFRETLLNSNATSSKARENEIKAFVKASFDEVVSERGRQAAVMDSCVEQVSQRQGPSDGIELELDVAEVIGTLDGLTNIDMSEPKRRLVDRTASIMGSAPGRATPSKRTADGVIKAPSIGRADGSISPHLGGDSIITALAVTRPKVAQGDSKVGSKMAVFPQNTRPLYHPTLVSESETQQAKLSQSFAPCASNGLKSLPLFRGPTRSHTVKLSVGRDRLLKIVGEGSSSHSVKPPSRQRVHPQSDGTKLHIVPSKASSSLTKGKPFLSATVSTFKFQILP
jgi:hypothetical protein